VAESAEEVRETKRRHKVNKEEAMLTRER